MYNGPKLLWPTGHRCCHLFSVWRSSPVSRESPLQSLLCRGRPAYPRPSCTDKGKSPQFCIPARFRRAEWGPSKPQIESHPSFFQGITRAFSSTALLVSIWANKPPFHSGSYSECQKAKQIINASFQRRRMHAQTTRRSTSSGDAGCPGRGISALIGRGPRILAEPLQAI